MSHFLKGNYEKILVMLAAGTLTLSLGWTWLRSRELRLLDEARARMTGRAYVPAAWRVPEPDRAIWPKALEQSAGGGWLYELFTPPVVYYNADTRSFAVTPSLHPVQEPEGMRELPPRDVKRELFRLQLVGYFGSPDDYLLAFVSPGSAETLLARVGRRFDELGLTLKSFEVGKVAVEHDEPWPVYEVAGLATLRDERTGTEVVLDTRSRKLTDASLAMVESPAGRGSTDEADRAPRLSTSQLRDVANHGP